MWEKKGVEKNSETNSIFILLKLFFSWMLTEFFIYADTKLFWEDTRGLDLFAGNNVSPFNQQAQISFFNSGKFSSTTYLTVACI